MSYLDWHYCLALVTSEVSLVLKHFDARRANDSGRDRQKATHVTRFRQAHSTELGTDRKRADSGMNVPFNSLNSIILVILRKPTDSFMS